MSILDKFSNLFGAAGKIIDEVYTSEEEKQVEKRKFLEVQLQGLGKALDAELEHQRLGLEAYKADIDLKKAQAEIIKAEANSESWITKSWRPLAMCVFILLGLADAIGIMFGGYLDGFTALPPEYREHYWTALTYGLSGYVVSRGIEKSMKHFKSPSEAARKVEEIVDKK